MGAELAVVTGGAGFIGSHLVEALRSQGDAVRVVDNFPTGRRSLVPAGVELLEGDVNDVALKAVRGASVVYHLAALPSVPRSVKQPLESHRATAQGTLAVLAAAEQARVRRVVVASSSSVYGDTPTLPKHEGMAPNPLSPYAAAKLASERYAQSWAARGGIETVSLRFFNVYGPRQDPDSPYAAVIPIFLRKLKEGAALPVFGDGGQTRDFTFVEDAVLATMAALTRPAPEFAYNVGGGHRVALAEVLDRIERLVGRPIERRHVEPQRGDPRDTAADTALARRDLGYEPRTSLEQGLSRQWEWQRNI